MLQLAEDGFYTIGHTHLRWAGTLAPSEGQEVLDLEPAGKQLDVWWRAGAIAGVQALHPYTALAPRLRGEFSVLFGGAGAALPALVALLHGIGRVAVVLDAADRRAFEAVAETIQADTTPEFPDRIGGAAGDTPFQFAAHGCGGVVPTAPMLYDYLRCLPDHGTLATFGFPEDRQQDLFTELARRDLHLEAAGRREGVAFLAGIALNMRRFSPGAA